MKKSILTRLLLSVLTIVSTIFLIFATVKGDITTVSGTQTYGTGQGSPLEGSNSSSRFALTKALAERGTFFLDRSEAMLASPDVAKFEGRYVSLFMPGISLIAVPLYKLGSYFGQPQIWSYLVNIIFSLANGCVVFLLSRRLVNKTSLNLLAGFSFIFGTNAWAYSLSFTQHQVSTFVLLSGLLLATKKITVANNMLMGFVFGLGLLVDFPNAILMFPIVLCQILRHLDFGKNKVNLTGIWMLFGLLPTLLLFFYYNIQTAGSPFFAAQFIGRSTDFSVQATAPVVQKKVEQNTSPTIHIPFKTRHMLQGFIVLLASNERGWFYYSPAIAMCIIGLYIATKKSNNIQFHQMATAVIGLNIVAYSMFGDPWGGWSFGPRYLIPATAIAFIYLPFIFEMKINKYIIALIFLILVGYSVNLSSLGALTTSSIPPKQEAEHLVTPIPWTPELNRTFIKTKTSSLFYNLELKELISPTQYQQLIFLLAIIVITSLTGYAIRSKD